ncbi:MAG: ATP-binding protein [Clostridia bacterium]|nr:ATP-binding protein [Clostridia bacterium]MBQ3462584.1 ATP-binding protein [Clostridia bacterium]
MDDMIKQLPEMKTGNELISALSVLPNYDDAIRYQNQAARLIALYDLYKIYVPSPMSTEIYSKLYLALLRSIHKKMTKAAIQQRNQNHNVIIHQDYNGILGGSDSFTIIGTSGIGKSSAINRAIDLLCKNGVIETNKPYTKVIPCLVVQCPFDSSVKGLLLEILRKVDESIDSDYYTKALKIRVTTDMLIGSVSQVAVNHIGLLVVDEIQNVVNSKNGKSLVGMLTQLINNSGISICMVGTPESTVFFEQAVQLARRSLGLQYYRLEYNQYFYDFCCTLFSYQYTRNKTAITDSIIRWLYEHSGGIISIVVSLIHDAQEIAILNGSEALNLEALNEAYKKRMTMLHGYISESTKRKPQTTANRKNKPELPDKQCEDGNNKRYIYEIIAAAKSNKLDVAAALKEHITIEEVQI